MRSRRIPYRVSVMRNLRRPLERLSAALFPPCLNDWTRSMLTMNAVWTDLVAVLLIVKTGRLEAAPLS